MRAGTDWTWDRVRTAAASTSGWRRTRRGEWRGPCQCGGERDRAWIRRGRRGVIAGCNAGCDGVAVLAWLTGDGLPRGGGGLPPVRFDRPGARPLSRPAPPSASEGDNGRFRANRPPPPKNGAPGSPRIDAGDATRPPAPPDSGPPKPDRASALWADSRPVPLDPEHPARRWAARRHLWRLGDPWPEAVRWIPWRDGGGSLVACFAPVADWTEAHPPTPTGVQLVHVGPDGLPRKDRAGIGKRSHGTMRGGVCVIGPPLWRSGLVHIAEGVADALAVAAREDAPALATAGTGALSRLAPSLAALHVPVVIHADGDPAGILAARRLRAALADVGALADVIEYPPGCDPAQPKGNA